MTADREELRRLVEDLPAEQVPGALDDIRRRLTPRAARPWPPAWFGAGQSQRTDTASHADELLADRVSEL